jgi:hypothetical protein
VREASTCVYSFRPVIFIALVFLAPTEIVGTIDSFYLQVEHVRDERLSP